MQVLESQNLTDSRTPESGSKTNRWLRAAVLTLLHITASDIQYTMIDKKICALRGVPSVIVKR
jgi:hypothetical protein